MLADIRLWLTVNEPIISALVGIVTLIAAVWGVLKLRNYDASKVVAGAPDSASTADNQQQNATRGKFTTTPQKLLNLGITPRSQIEEIVASRTVNATVVGMLVLNLVWILAGLIETGLVFLTIMNGVVFLGGLLILVLQASNKFNAARWLTIVMINSYWCFTQFTIGRMWGIEYFLVLLCLLPILLFERHERKQQVLAGLLLLGFLALQFMLGRLNPEGALELPLDFLKYGYVINLLILCLLVIGLISYYSNYSLSSYHAMEQEKARADNLVNAILPKDVVAQIREHPKKIATYRDEAVVMFACLEGIDGIYNKVTARQLVELLTRIFLDFDNLLEKHGVEKINVLGNHYVAGSGIFGGAPSHLAVARFALDATAALKKIGEDSNQQLSLRVGISTGDVVSGVIGEARPCFDIWGETVELAVSMQDAATSNTVVVSEQFYSRLQNYFDFAELTDSQPNAYILVREKLNAAEPPESPA